MVIARRMQNLHAPAKNELSFVSRFASGPATIAVMGKPGDRDEGKTSDDTDVDPVEKRLVAARERLREANERLNTREHAIISATRRPTEDDDRPTEPRIIVPLKR